MSLFLSFDAGTGRRALHAAMLGAALACFSGVGASQTLPDAGSIRQQIEPQRELPLPPPALRPERVQPPPEISPPRPGLTVTVRAFRFAGNRLLQAEQLAPAVADYLNRPLSFDELRRAADAVAAVYREAGWIVRVYLPEQDIGEGIVTLQIIEARYGGLRFETELSKRVRPSEIEAIFQAHQQIGQPLDAAALDRALLLADDLPGVSVAGTLVAGAADGETALVLKTTDELLVYGDIGIDNNGARATGSTRLTASLNINSPLGNGELFSANLLHTDGSDYSRVALSVPVGYDGLRVSLNASYLRYKVIDGPGSNSAAQIRGNSSGLGLDLSYPLIRARLHNLYLSGALENKTFYTRDLLVRSDYESDSLRLSLSGNKFDEFGGGGANSAALQLLWGRLGSMTAHTLAGSIDRSYRKINYSLARQQTVTAEHSVLLSLVGQHADHVLDSSEKFYLGGVGSVRAYPASEVGGDRGRVLSAEWRWRVTPATVLSAFVDHGEIQMLPATAADQYSSVALSGYGLGASWQGPDGLVLKLLWSRRHGQNPRPTATGTDGDGTLEIDRFWFNASLPF